MNYFSSSKTKFLQLLEELMINSYLCLYFDDWKNIFNFIKEIPNSHGNSKDKNDYFNGIYEKTKEYPKWVEVLRKRQEIISRII